MNVLTKNQLLYILIGFLLILGVSAPHVIKGSNEIVLSQMSAFWLAFIIFVKMKKRDKQDVIEFGLIFALGYAISTFLYVIQKF